MRRQAVFARAQAAASLMALLTWAGRPLLAVRADRAGPRAGPVAGSVTREAVHPVEVPAVAEAGRTAPGEVAVVSEAESGIAGECSALHTRARPLEMRVIPVGGERHQRNVGIVGDDWRT